MPRIAKTSVPAQIDRMVRRIVKKFHPEQIILFGSYARGDAGPDSDVDLLVVMDGEDSKMENAWEVRSSLDTFPVPVDVVVTSPQEFAWRKDVVGTIEWPASREGKVLYASERSAERPPKLRPKLDRKVQKQLTKYAAVLRYPEAGPDVPLTEARQAVAIARRVRKEVRRHLPRAALRREKP